MRTFVGVALTPECRSAIRDAVAPFRKGAGGVSWVREENLHLTLKFLGDVPAARVGEIGDLLERAGRECPSFDMVVAGAGGFPSLRAPRVLWVSIREPLELVGKLQENIETALAGAGFPREGRPFHAHVTVGRVKAGLPPGWAERFAETLSGARFGTVRVTSFQLYESRLSPGGAVYAVRRDVILGGGPASPGREEESR